MPTIAVDAMGGDLAPDAVVRAVAEVSLATGIQCVLVGDEARMHALLDDLRYNPENIELVHASDRIAMDEEPREAVRTKKHASILVATHLVEEGRCDAVVSAGNTGAAVLSCVRYFRMLPAVRRTGLASVFPRRVEYDGQDPLALLVDAGATIRCEPVDLVHFALMGSAYAKRVSKVAAPRIALLNMGREENKGGEVLIEAHRRLRALPNLNFVGNIEGHELLTGRADVVVCEGLLGNVVLKMMEGLGEVASGLATSAQNKWRWKIGMSLLSSGVEKLRELTDYASYGGAPILGFEHLLIKAHGRSGPSAIANAIKVAAKAVRDGVAIEIRDALSELRPE